MLILYTRILPLAYANCHVRGQLCRFCLPLFYLCFVWLFEIQFVCRFALFVGVWLASVAAASFWCYVVLFCVSTFIFIYLCCVRGEVEQPRICFALSHLPPASSPSFFGVHWQIVSHCELPTSLLSSLLPRFPHYVTDRSRKLRLWLLPYWQQELMTKCLA